MIFGKDNFGVLDGKLVALLIEHAEELEEIENEKTNRACTAIHVRC